MSVMDHKCQNCSAKLVFNPKKQKWVCDYCGSEYGLDDLKKNNEKETAENYIKKGAKKASNISYNSYNCPDCGAEIIMDENTSVTECVYCGNTAIIMERLVGEFKPEQIIPFKKDKSDAINTFLAYKKGKIFMPKDFISKKNIEKISGVYIPFYLYDMDTSASVKVEATRVKNWTDREYRYKRTDYFDAIRSGDMSFSKIPTDASKKFPDDIMDSIEPYEYRELVDFDASYMSGFLSEKYDLTDDELKDRAKKRAEQTAIQELVDDVSGYDFKTLKYSSANSVIVSSKYVLLPVWMLNVKYNDTIYTLAMNGQTGKFIGNVPISKKKIAIFWFELFLIVSLIVIAISLIGYIVK